MATFAKLFDLGEDAQVLVVRFLDEQETEGPHQLKVSTEYNGIYLEGRYGFKDETLRDEKFDTYDKNIAAQFLEAVIELTEGPDKKFEEEEQ